jgi:hypothetical protein
MSAQGAGARELGSRGSGQGVHHDLVMRRDDGFIIGRANDRRTRTPKQINQTYSDGGDKLKSGGAPIPYLGL